VENRTHQLTADDNKTPEDIEREMAQTRESLTEKVAALESQVVGTVQTAADTLSGTVEAVKELVSTGPGAVTESVKEAASAVSESVRRAFDIRGHVQDHPWASVGVSAGLGFLTGLLIPSGRSSSGSSSTYAAPAASLYPAAPPAPSRTGGMFDELIGMVTRKAREVLQTAIESASTAVTQTVRENVPKLVDAAAERLTPDKESAMGRQNGPAGYRH